MLTITKIIINKTNILGIISKMLSVKSLFKDVVECSKDNDFNQKCVVFVSNNACKGWNSPFL